MPIISKETWDKFTQEEIDKIKNMFDNFKEYRINMSDEKQEGVCYAIKELFPEECLHPHPLTYEDVARELYNNSVGIFGIPERDFSKKSDVKPWDYFGLYSKEAQQKVIAIIKLLNVAAYLNKNEDGTHWKPNWNIDSEKKFYLREVNFSISIDYTWNQNEAIVYFRTEELAEQAIQILREDTVRVALSSDY